MRLKPNEAKFIKQTTKQFFGQDAKVYLFGSRVFDHKKGGDIDLYVETTEEKSLFDKKVKMLQTLYKELGDQKIDLVINNFGVTTIPIHTVAKTEGILL